MMQVMHFEDAAVIERQGDDFRSGAITFRDLLLGEQGRPDNYGLQIVDIPGGYSTPQHRHNFEQIRIMLDGSFGFGAGRVQMPGSVGYFCEGTRYSQHGAGKSTTLLLQIGGPSKQGFMSRAQLQRGIEQLARQGQFKNGVYTWHDAAGVKHNQDSYEAVWEHIHQRKVRYRQPQYDGPVLFRPERFGYRAVAGQAGVALKRLARFNDYGLEIAQLRIEANACCVLDAASQPYLLFCLQGEGQFSDTESNTESTSRATAVAPAKAWRRWNSLRCNRGQTVTMIANQLSEFYLIGVPVFD